MKMIAALAPWILGLGCTPSDPPAAPSRPSPEGVVLEIAGLGLQAEEIEPLVADILALYPEYSRLHARRLALTNEFLPRLAVIAAQGAAREAARASCAQAAPADGQGTLREGGFRALGLGLWSAARHLEIGVWSPPLELTGRWVRLRLEQRWETPEVSQERLRLTVIECPYLDPARGQAGIEEAIDAARLSVLDEEFRDAVPEAWKYRMHLGPP